MPKTALITGVTGQDGTYLAELLLDKNYRVHGMIRRASSPNTQRIDHLISEANESPDPRFQLHYSDVTDTAVMIRLIKEIEPDEIYHLAAQSHVAVSFESPEYTANADALGTLRLLEAVRILGLRDKVRVYNAASSELFGLAQATPQNERTPFYPRSPYAVAKLYSFWITVNYREAYGMHASSGILFNHESPLRGETFVTRKITKAAARIKLGLQEKLLLGNLNARRDWGFAKDYVEAMWLMLQKETPSDYVIATGRSHSVREFCEAAFKAIGISLTWRGSGSEEVGIDSETNRTVVGIDPQYFRPTEVESLVGDYSKAKKELGWQPKVDFEGLVKIMAAADLDDTKRMEIGAADASVAVES